MQTFAEIHGKLPKNTYSVADRLILSCLNGFTEAIIQYCHRFQSYFLAEITFAKQKYKIRRGNHMCDPKISYNNENFCPSNKRFYAFIVLSLAIVFSFTLFAVSELFTYWTSLAHENTVLTLRTNWMRLIATWMKTYEFEHIFNGDLFQIIEIRKPILICFSLMEFS